MIYGTYVETVLKEMNKELKVHIPCQPSNERSRNVQLLIDQKQYVPLSIDQKLYRDFSLHADTHIFETKVYFCNK